MIVFSDFDKTLYPYFDDTGFIRNLAIIQAFRQKGNQFCLATNRNQSSLERAWPDYRDYLDYAILDNGTVCLNQHGDVVFQKTIPFPVAKDIATKTTAKFGENVAIIFYHSAKEWQTPDDNTTKIRCWTKDLPISESIFHEIESAYPDSLRSSIIRNAAMPSITWVKHPEQYHAFVDTMSANAGKYHAIQRLLKTHTGEKVITIGDGANDLAMIQQYDGYAMRNSASEILKIVNPTHIIKSVADLLEKL